MKIKFITTILLLCMPILTFAASWADNGSYDVSWYKKSQTEFQISTAKELAGMAYLVNNNYTSFEGKTVKLAADINLGEKYWKPIGMGNTIFEGTFDGDGHRIYNVHINEGDRLYRSGFWVSVVNATLKNFKLFGTVSIDGDTTIGLVAGRAAKSTISDIYVDGIIKFKNESVSTNTGFKYWYQIGGCVGEAADARCRSHYAHGRTDGIGLCYVVARAVHCRCWRDQILVCSVIIERVYRQSRVGMLQPCHQLSSERQQRSTNQGNAQFLGSGNSGVGVRGNLH